MLGIRRYGLRRPALLLLLGPFLEDTISRSDHAYFRGKHFIKNHAGDCARNRYQEALVLYFLGDIRQAKAGFADLAEETADKAAILMAKRCDQLLADGVSEDWTGAFVYELK